MKNPYKRTDRRQAFKAAIEHLKSGLNRFEASKQLDKAIPRYKRQEIAAKAARMLRRTNK